MTRALAFLFAWLAAIVATPALAQPEFPERGTAPVVDAAEIIPPDVEADLTAKLDQFEETNQRQFVVATIADLQGYDIADYGYQLGRHWGLGDKENDDGVLLIVAPNERKVRIEVGYGLEPVLTDGLSALIIQRQILPRFRDGDMPGGIVVGTDAIIQQLQLPEEEARAIAAQAQERPQEEGGFPIGVVIWLVFLVIFVVLPMIARAARGKKYRGRGRRGDVAGTVGEVLLWTAVNAALHSKGGDSGGGYGGFGGGGGGFGGFSGGGGSFGGGGASGGW
jgi:uncharacterized protein